jgi:CHAT domain-containing protein
MVRQTGLSLLFQCLAVSTSLLVGLSYASPLSNVGGEKAQEALSLYNRAYIERDRGNFDSALTQIEDAIAIVENLPTNIPREELRASYFATVQGYYQLHSDLLMQRHRQSPGKGYDAQAWEMSDRTRARTLIEHLTETGANIRSDADPKLLEQERNLLQQLNSINYQKYQLLSGQHTQQEIDEIKQKIATNLAQLDQLKVQIRLSSSRYAAIKYPPPLTLQEIQQQVLDEDTILLEYSLGEERSYLWAVTKSSITSYQLPKRSEIESAVKIFRESITSSAAKLESGIPLSRIILAPIASQLGNKRLLIVADGALQYVPFAALPIPSSPSTPLLVRNEIITLPSASLIAIQRQQRQNRPMAAKNIAVIADPVFNLNDPRLPNRVTNSAQSLPTRNLGLGRGGFQFDRLPYTRTEAEKILALVPENQRLQALDFEADRATVTNPNLAKYKIIHFATHMVLDDVNHELSGIVLSLYDRNGKSQDGFLYLYEIYNLNLPAELVVLSGDKTSLGKDVKGEGLISLTRGFLSAGAKQVVGSLSSVNDAATSELMAKFYQKMLQEGQKPAAALREAQLEMWNSGQWQSPYYWAAFTVQGDWR